MKVGHVVVIYIIDSIFQMVESFITYLWMKLLKTYIRAHYQGLEKHMRCSFSMSWVLVNAVGVWMFALLLVVKLALL